MEEEDHTAVGGRQLNNKAKLNVGVLFVVAPFSVVQGVVHVVWGKEGVPPLNRALLWPYHRFYTNRFCREDLLKQ